jgi:hypothetical protein
VPVATAGPRRDLSGVGYDVVRGRIVLFGGYSNPTDWADTWELASAAPSANASAYGAGCAGTTGVPALGALGLPKLGSATFALSLNGARPNAPAAVLFAEQPASVPVGGGCTLLVLDPFASVGLTVGGSGGATLPLAVPSGLGLLGLELRLQGVVADPLGSLGGAASTTGGLHLVLGS